MSAALTATFIVLHSRQSTHSFFQASSSTVLPLSPPSNCIHRPRVSFFFFFFILYFRSCSSYISAVVLQLILIIAIWLSDQSAPSSSWTHPQFDYRTIPLLLHTSVAASFLFFYFYFYFSSRFSRRSPLSVTCIIHVSFSGGIYLLKYANVASPSISFVVRVNTLLLVSWVKTLPRLFHLQRHMCSHHLLRYHPPSPPPSPPPEPPILFSSSFCAHFLL